MTNREKLVAPRSADFQKELYGRPTFAAMSEFDRFIKQIEAAPALNSAAEARELLVSADLTSDSLRPYENFDHSAVESYGRTLVTKNPNMEVMVMSWASGDISAIHDHGKTTFGAVRVLGPAMHNVFVETEKGLRLAKRELLSAGQILSVAPGFIHQLGNYSRQPFLSLHLYGSASRFDDSANKARIFDLHNKKIYKSDAGAFFLPELHGAKFLGEAVTANLPTQDADQIPLLVRCFKVLCSERNTERSIAEEMSAQLASSLLGECSTPLLGALKRTGRYRSIPWHRVLRFIETQAIRRRLLAVR